MFERFLRCVLHVTVLSSVLPNLLTTDLESVAAQAFNTTLAKAAHSTWQGSHAARGSVSIMKYLCAVPPTLERTMRDEHEARIAVHACARPKTPVSEGMSLKEAAHDGRLSVLQRR